MKSRSRVARRPVAVAAVAGMSSGLMIAAVSLYARFSGYLVVVVEGSKVCTRAGRVCRCRASWTSFFEAVEGEESGLLLLEDEVDESLMLMLRVWMGGRGDACWRVCVCRVLALTLLRWVGHLLGFLTACFISEAEAEPQCAGLPKQDSAFVG